MDRREFMAGAGVVAGSLLAGCTGGSSEGSDSTPRTNATSSSSTSTSTATSAELPPGTQRVGMLEASAGDFVAKESLRYYSESDGGLAELSPENDWWVVLATRFSNLGGDPVPAPSQSSVSLKMAGGTYEPLPELPGVSWESLRLRDQYRSYIMEPGYLGHDPDKPVKPGDDPLLYSLYDVPAAQSPVVVWTSESETVRMSPRPLLLPSGPVYQR